MSLSEPPAGYLLVLAPVFCHGGRQFFESLSNVRYFLKKERSFSFLMVFILSQSDIHCENYGNLVHKS